MSRRANHEATIETIPGTPLKYRAVVKIDRQRICGPRSLTKSLALAGLKEKLRAQESPAKEELTLSTFMYQELQGPLRTEWAPKTWLNCMMVWRTKVNVHPIGAKPLSAIVPDDLRLLYHDLQASVSLRSSVRYFSFVRTMLGRAKNQGRIIFSPVQGIKDPATSQVEKDIRSSEDVMALIDHITAPRLKRAIILCAHGLRPAEACGTRYEWIQEGVVSVKKQVQEVGGRIALRDPKSWNGIREVPLNPKFHHLFEGASVGWVLCASTGAPYRPDDFRGDFRRVIKGTRWEGMKLYDLRSSFGTALLLSGADVRTAAEIMGHSPAILAEVYARSKRAKKQEAVKKLWA